MARYFVERVDTPLPEASSGESKDGAPLLISHSLDVRVGGKLPPHLVGGKQGEQDSLLPFGAQLRTWSRACQQEFWHTRRRFWGAQRLGKLQAACRRRQLSVREVDALPNSAARMPFCSRPSPLPRVARWRRLWAMCRRCETACCGRSLGRVSYEKATSKKAGGWQASVLGFLPESHRRLLSSARV